jgi:hypothetical protein
MPYVTVTTDDEGGACWAVVGLGTVVRCYTGHHAITVLQDDVYGHWGGDP